MSASDTAWAFAARGKSIANPAPTDAAPNCRRVIFVVRTYSVLSVSVRSSHMSASSLTGIFSGAVAHSYAGSDST